MEIKDINLEEYEISEQKDKEIIVLKKEEKQIPNMGRLRKYFGCVYWGEIRIF